MSTSPIAPLIKGLSEEGMGHHSDSVPLRMCNVNAAQLATSAGGPIVPNNPIDKAIAQGVPFAVRLFFGRGAGVEAASWLTALGQVTLHDPIDNITATVARWWEADVQAAQRSLVAKLAAYDGKIPLIYIANGGTIYAEPFIRGIQDESTRHNLLQAGYTPEADLASYKVGYGMFGAFKITRLAQAFNPWQYVKPDGSGAIDVTKTIAMMDTFAAMFPRRAVWANNSIRISGGWPAPAYQQIYDHMRQAHTASGRAIRFQTATKPRVGSYVEVLKWAIDHGAHAVELSPGFTDCGTSPCLTPAQMADFNGKLQAA